MSLIVSLVKNNSLSKYNKICLWIKLEHIMSGIKIVKNISANNVTFFTISTVNL